MLKPPFSIIQKRKHDEYVDYIEKSMLTKETEADTSLIVKDSDEFYGKLSVYGGQRQEKREGYNKFNIDAVTNNFIDATTGATVASSDWRLSDYIEVKALTNYLLSWKSSSAYFQSIVTMYDESKTFLSGVQLTENNTYKKVFQTIENCKYIKIAYSVNVANNEVTREEIMFCEGTEQKPYEPYGVMPSLQYPSEIEGVGDNIQLLQNSNQKVSSFGLTAEMQQDESVKILGKSTASSQVYLTNIKKINVADIEDEDYIFGFRNALVLNHIGIRLRKNNNGVLTEIDNFKLDTINKTRTLNLKSLIDTSTTEIQLDLILYSTEKYDMTLHIKCEKGSKATSYSSFGQGSVEISTSNKNIYDKNTMKLTKGLWIHGAKIGGNGAEWYVIVPIIGGKTITISRKVKETFYVTTTADYPAAGVAVVDTWKEVKNTNKYTMTTNEKAKYLFLGLAAASSLTNEQIAHAVDELQIEYVDKYSSYVEHRGKTYIMPIQQPMFDEDGFEKIDGVWYEKHNKVKIVFDGTENWSFNYNSAIFILDANNILTLSSAEASKLSNFIQSNTYSNKVYDTMYLEQTNGIEALNNRINIRESSCSTVAEFKTLLAQRYAENKAIYAVCRLKEPILLKCTDEQSAMLDKIDTYRDGTIITTDNNLCKIQLRYKQDLDKRISEIEKQILGGN